MSALVATVLVVVWFTGSVDETTATAAISVDSLQQLSLPGGQNVGLSCTPIDNMTIVCAFGGPQTTSQDNLVQYYNASSRRFSPFLYHPSTGVVQLRRMRNTLAVTAIADGPFNVAGQYYAVYFNGEVNAPVLTYLTSVAYLSHPVGKNFTATAGSTLSPALSQHNGGAVAWGSRVMMAGGAVDNTNDCKLSYWDADSPATAWSLTGYNLKGCRDVGRERHAMATASTPQGYVFFAGGQSGGTTPVYYNAIDVIKADEGSFQTPTYDYNLVRARSRLAGCTVTWKGRTQVLFGGGVGTGTTQLSNEVDVIEVGLPLVNAPPKQTWTLSVARCDLSCASSGFKAYFAYVLHVFHSTSVVCPFFASPPLSSR